MSSKIKDSKSCKRMLFKEFVGKASVLKMLLLVSIICLLYFPTAIYGEDIPRGKVYVNYDITTNTSWDGNNDYIICYKPDGSVPAVKPDVTLTIPSGAKVFLGTDAPSIYVPGQGTFAPSGEMNIYGNIIANGVQFTALVLDNITYQWSQIKLMVATQGIPVNATFNGCTFEKGGVGSSGMVNAVDNNTGLSDGQEINITVDNCVFQDARISSIPSLSQTWQHSGISYSNGYYHANSGNIVIRNTTFQRLGNGIFVDSNNHDPIDVTIDNCTFTELSKQVSDWGGVAIRDGRNISVTNSTFTNIGDIIGSDSALILCYEYSSGNYPTNITLKGNTFDGNNTATNNPIVIHAASKINAADGSYSNTFNNYNDDVKYARIYSNSKVGTVDAIWGELGIPYLVSNTLTIGPAMSYDGNSGSLTIKPGASITLKGNGGIVPYTTFSAIGTADKPIRINTTGTLTSYNKLNISSCRTDFTLKHCILDGLTYGVYGDFPSSGDSIDNFIVENCTFKNMTNNGIYINDLGRFVKDKAIIKNSIFENNLSHGLYARCYSYYYPNETYTNNLKVQYSTFRNNAGTGLYAERAHGLIIANCLIYGNGANGVTNINSYNFTVNITPPIVRTPPLIENCTISKNNGYGLENKGVSKDTYGATLKNSILSGNSSDDLKNTSTNINSPMKDGSVTYSCITNTTGALGIGSIQGDPLFVDLINNDFHVKSQGGRWNGTNWVNDTFTSPCVDSGDATSEFINESAPNGDRINMGYYGNTTEASKSKTQTQQIVIAAPTKLTALPTSYDSIQLSWDSVDKAGYYEIYQGTSSDGTYALIKTQPASATTYVNTGLETGKTYYYKVRGYALDGESKVYSEFSPVITGKPVLATVKNLKSVSAGYNSIFLSWTGVAGASGYSIYRAPTSTGTYSLVANTTSISYRNIGLTTGVTYYYKVKAYRTVGTIKVYGNLTTGVSAKPIPATPVNFKASRYNSTSIKVSWYVVSGANGYEVYRARSLTGTYSLIKSTTGSYYTNTGLRTSNAYYYKVRAFRFAGKTRVYSPFTVVKYVKI